MKLRTIKKYIWLILIFLILLLPACKHKKEYTQEYIDTKTDLLKEKYDININKIGSDINKSQENYEYEICKDTQKIGETLDAIEKIMDRLPDDIINRMMNLQYGDFEIAGSIDDFNIIICSNLACKLDDTNYTIEMGELDYAVMFDQALFIDADYGNLEDKFAKGMGSLIQQNINISEMTLKSENGKIIEDGISPIYQQWKELNPQNFTYFNECNQKDRNEIANISNEYFVNENALTTIYNDMDYTFMYLLSTDEKEELPDAYDNPHIREKAKYLCNYSNHRLRYTEDETYWSSWFLEDE